MAERLLSPADLLKEDLEALGLLQWDIWWRLKGWIVEPLSNDFGESEIGQGGEDTEVLEKEVKRVD